MLCCSLLESLLLLQLFGLIEFLLFGFCCLESCFLLVWLEHVLRSASLILDGFWLLASMAFFSSFEVVVLAFRAFPSSVWELKAVSLLAVLLAFILLILLLVFLYLDAQLFLKVVDEAGSHRERTKMTVKLLVVLILEDLVAILMFWHVQFLAGLLMGEQAL